MYKVGEIVWIKVTNFGKTIKYLAKVDSYYATIDTNIEKRTYYVTLCNKKEDFPTHYSYRVEENRIEPLDALAKAIYFLI